MSHLSFELVARARTLPEGDPIRQLLSMAAGEIDGLREQVDALREALHAIDKAVRSPVTINALMRSNT